MESKFKVTVLSIDKEMPVQVQSEDDSLAVVAMEDAAPQKTIPMSTDIIIHKGYSPFINEETGTWFEYDNAKKAFVDTGITAQGINNLATEEEAGLLSPEDKVKINSLKDIAFQGKFSDLQGFATLTIGDYQFDGTEDVEVPVYAGTTSDVIIPDVTLANYNQLMTNEENYSMQLENFEEQSYNMHVDSFEQQSYIMTADTADTYDYLMKVDTNDEYSMILTDDSQNYSMTLAGDAENYQMRPVENTETYSMKQAPASYSMQMDNGDNYQMKIQ